MVCVVLVVLAMGFIGSCKFTFKEEQKMTGSLVESMDD